MTYTYARVGDAFLPTLWSTEAAKQARKRARLRRVEYGLTLGWILGRLETQHYCCAVSGVPFSGQRTRLGSHKRPWMPSLDRIDCAKGYTTDNVRIVCVAVNTLLQDWGDEVFRIILSASGGR